MFMPPEMLTHMPPYLIALQRGPRGLDEYARIHGLNGYYHRHVPQPNRGATRSVIERNTHAHKYPKREKCDAEDSIEKCTICLCEFEVSEDVR